MIPSEQSQNFPMKLSNPAASRIILLAPDAVAVLASLLIMVSCLGQDRDVGCGMCEVCKRICVMDKPAKQWSHEATVKSAPGG